MASLPIPLPVVLCGRSAAIGKPVSEALLPEYEVIHFITTNEAAEAELPILLAGGDPQATQPNDVGSHNYSQPARAVIFGRGYEREEIERFRRTTAGSTKEPVVWVISDPEKTVRQTPTGLPPGYAKTVTDLVKEQLDQWKASGAAEDAVLLY